VFVYRAQNHDTGAKSVFGLNVPAGGGKEDGDKLLDYLAEHPSTARFVSRKLLQRFVADDPPARLLDRTAATFESTGGDIGAVMRTIVGSAEFWAEAFGPGKPRTPLEFVVGALRAVDAQVNTGRALVATLAALGQPLFACLPPTGYSNRGDDWLNPSSHLGRMNFALDLAANAVAGVSVDLRALPGRLGADPGNPRALADGLSRELFGGGLSAATRDAAARAAATGAVPVASRVLGLVLASPDMQAR
jgi:uncharacterized protein (DUF1800 family)